MRPLKLDELNLDWELALRRLGQDIRDDFWPDPLELADLLANKAKTVDGLKDDLAAFKAAPAVCLQIPKKNLTLRTSFELRSIDRIVYQALVDRISPPIDPRLSNAVFSHRLGKPGDKWLFRYRVGQWKEFRAAVRESLRGQPGQYLVVTDLSQYFENVDFRALRRQLEHLAGPDFSTLKGVIEAVHSCLKIWSPYKTCGLPQNVDASSFLGNVLLDYVDRRMLREGYQYFRYMDDMRIIVGSEADARVCLMRLIGFLRDIHLGVNSGKTKIIGPDDPEMHEHMADDDPEIDQIEAAVKTKNPARIQEIVPLLFRKTRSLIAERKTDERVFRFCVNRIIGLLRYRELDLPEHADITCKMLEMLPQRPAESDTICRFLSCAPLSQEDENEISRLLTSEPLCVYPWQNFHLWRLATQKRIQSDSLLRRAHELLRSEPSNPEVGAAALLLGACGDYADRHAISRLAGAPVSTFVGRCIHVSLQELHAADRTPVLKRLSDQGYEAEVLSEHIRNLSEPVYVPDPPPIGVEDLPEFMPSVY